MNDLQLTKPSGPVTLKSLLAKPDYQARFKEVLGEKAQQFCTSLINVGNTMLDCDPHSIIQSSMIAAALDLPIDKNLGFSWIVPYKRNDEKLAQFQIGYKGFVQLALRSGQYKRMNARSVNAEVFVKWDEVGEPVLDWEKMDESKPVAGYVFAFQLVNGFTKVCYWPKKRIEEHAKRYSQAYRKGYESPWKSNFDGMALKTVVKNELAKWGILSIQMQEAATKDQAVVEVDGTVTFADNAETAPQPAGFIAAQETPKSKKKESAPVVEVAQVVTAEVVEEKTAPVENAPADKSLEEIVDGENFEERAEILALRKAMSQHEITEASVIAFCRARGLLKEGSPETASLKDIQESKVSPLTKNILAAGDTMKKIRESK